jgi:N-methyl-L-proline demethylase
VAAELADACHEHDCKVMIQLTHLGRRTRWNTGDWLPVLSASPVREPAHRAFPKEAEDWDIDRIVADYASAAQRMQAAGLDGIEFEAYGHLMDSFWSPATNRRRGCLRRFARQPPCLHLAGAGRRARGRRSGFHRRHPHGRRRGPGPGLGDEGVEIARRLAGSGRSTSSTSSAATSTPTPR